MNPAHLDYDVLADLAEGLLDDDHAASASAHLDDCTECRERSAELADVSRLLADIPVPPMPADLATRIDDAIRAESMATAMDRATVASLERQRSRRHWRIFSAAATTLVAIGGGAVVGNLVMANRNNSDAPAAAAVPKSENGSRASRNGDTAVAPEQTEGNAFPAAPPRVVRSGTAYTATSLGTQIPLVMRKYQEQRSNPMTAKLSECVTSVARRNPPVLVDEASYDGAPATVIVMPGGGAMWNVVVVRPDCSKITSQRVPSKVP